jgi:hypothetical protein
VVVEREILDLTLELDNARGAELLFQFVRALDRLVADRSDEALDAFTALPIFFHQAQMSWVDHYHIGRI